MTTNGIDRSGSAGGSGAAVTPVDANVVDAKGDLIVGTADNAVDNLTVGTNEMRLVADSAQTLGVKWVADTTNYAINAKGDLLAGTAADTAAPLTVGANEKRVVADSAQTTGLKYVADTTNYAIDAKGDLLAGTAADTLQAVTVGANAKVLTADSTATPGVSWLDVPLPRGYLAGYGLTNNASDATNDIDFAIGAARNSTNVANLVAATAMTKQLDGAWVAGSATGGGRLSAAAIANTTYFCYAIRKDSDGTIDFGFDTSATAPTMPGGYTFFRRIGSIVRSGGTILAFIQDGDKFVWNWAVGADINANNPGTAAVTRTLTLPVGIRVEAILNASLANFDPAIVPKLRLSDLSTIDNAAAQANSQVAATFSGAGNTTIASGECRVFTNTSAQIRSRLDASSASVTVVIGTMGWVDRRGRDD